MIDDQDLVKLFDMVDEAKDELVGLEQDLVRIRSVNTGGHYGTHWLVANHPEKIRSDWAVNEGGGMPRAACLDCGTLRNHARSGLLTDGQR